MTSRRVTITLATIFVVGCVVRLIAATLVPVVQDEAYYLLWSRSLDWGYFDHPPLVAWLSTTERLAPAGIVAGRLGAMAAAAMAFPFMLGLMRHAGVDEDRRLLAGMWLLAFNFCGLASGILTTPDAAFVTAWCIALHEGAAALARDRRRWLTAGLAVGVGGLAKYVMALIAPVFLIAIIFGDRRALRSPWPYLGGLVALLVLAPHLAWNARNEWVPIRMQLEHGLTGAQDPPFAPTTDLPAPASARTEAPAAPNAMGELVARLGTWLGAILVVWGVFVATIVGWFVENARGGARGDPPLRASVRPLLYASALVPIIFFGLVSLVEAIEVNWPAVSAIGLAVIVSGHASRWPRSTVVLGLVNAAILVIGAVHVAHPLTPLGRDRIERETAGWPQLATHVARLDLPVFSARWQTVAMVRWHDPDAVIDQWPQLGRPSEFVRRADWSTYDLATVSAAGGFYLVLDRHEPPTLRGFVCDEVMPLERWFVARYSRSQLRPSGEEDRE